ncbi:hypothetical protein LEP1GSC125_1602 [Leptospira mayottensis 200901122]|uniref:Uncharacterized protein n=1 Tax=Leptospira mayottensis 200901122 TaxID=1193010 RepID=A0AA87MSP5_9LEPT|nr:hypothetical protein LEP1GSC125_1602 [Leptospira mayottensis 200901122]
MKTSGCPFGNSNAASSFEQWQDVSQKELKPSHFRAAGIEAESINWE